MKRLAATVAVTLALAFGFSQRAPQAAKVERVERACARLRASFSPPYKPGKDPLGKPNSPTEDAIANMEQGHSQPVFVSGIVEARMYELLCLD